MKLQNIDIIIFLKTFLGQYGTSFEIFIYKINKQNIYIYYVFSSFNPYFYFLLTASIMNKRDWVDSSSSTEIKIRKRIYKIAMNSDYIIVHRKLTVSLPGAH